MTDRTIDITELRDITRSVREKKHAVLSEPLVESLVRKVAALIGEKVDFAEAMRFALNELCVRDPKDRKLYCSVMGKYFGRHGGHKAAKNKAAGKLPKRRVRKDQKAVLEKSGQMSWKM